nr:hypothetical protein [Deltaproteobacteria bacterium]
MLLHLDVLTTTHTGLTLEARESIPLLYENPGGAAGLSDRLPRSPKVIRGVFPAKREITGIPREALPRIIPARGEGPPRDGFDPFGMYKVRLGV